MTDTALDCPTICANFDRGDIISTIRTFLSTLRGYNPACSEAELFVFGLAAYKPHCVDLATLRNKALADCREWYVHGRLPDYMGSWFNEAHRCTS